MASLGNEIQRHIGEELRVLYATATDQMPEHLAVLLRKLKDKIEPSANDEQTRAKVGHASD
jgi:hypothetical protein